MAILLTLNLSSIWDIDSAHWWLKKPYKIGFSVSTSKQWATWSITILYFFDNVSNTKLRHAKWQVDILLTRIFWICFIAPSLLLFSCYSTCFFVLLLLLIISSLFLLLLLLFICLLLFFFFFFILLLILFIIISLYCSSCCYSSVVSFSSGQE